MSIFLFLPLFALLQISFVVVMADLLTDLDAPSSEATSGAEVASVK